MSTNIGVDFTAFRGRVDLSADYYIKNTDNLLLDITKAPSVGVTTSRENIGEVQNSGFELRLRTFPIQNKDWQWSETWSAGSSATHPGPAPRGQ